MSVLVFTLDEKMKQLTVTFPETVISTHFDDLRQQFATFRAENEHEIKFTHATLDFNTTTMVDSMGLNLVADAVRWLKQKNVTVTAKVGHGSVRLVFMSVRFDRQMEIVYTGAPLQGIDA